jgi:hypothetical protein
MADVARQQQTTAFLATIVTRTRRHTELTKKVYSFCLMVEASDHLYVLGDTYTCHTYYCYLSPV